MNSQRRLQTLSFSKKAWSATNKDAFNILKYIIHMEYYQSSACNLDFWRVPPPPPLPVPLSWPVWTSSFMSECVCVNGGRWMSVCVKTDTVVPPVAAGCSCSSAARCCLWRSLCLHLRRPLLCVCLAESRSWVDDGVGHLLPCELENYRITATGSLRCQCVYFHALPAHVCVRHTWWIVSDVILKRDLHIERSPWKELTGGN